MLELQVGLTRSGVADKPERRAASQQTCCKDKVDAQCDKLATKLN